MSEALQILKNTGNTIPLDRYKEIIDSVLSGEDTFALCQPEVSMLSDSAMMMNEGFA
jgi:hypothetical protein